MQVLYPPSVPRLYGWISVWVLFFWILILPQLPFGDVSKFEDLLEMVDFKMITVVGNQSILEVPNFERHPFGSGLKGWTSDWWTSPKDDGLEKRVMVKGNPIGVHLGCDMATFCWCVSYEVQTSTTWINCGNSTAVAALHQKGKVGSFREVPCRTCFIWGLWKSK